MAKRFRKVSPARFSESIVEELEDYVAEEQDDIRAAIEKGADTARSELAQTSPKRTGLYAKGWRKHSDIAITGYTATVYHVAPGYRLTHLLEKGHGGPHGPAAPHPHIAKAAEHGKQAMIEALK